MLVHFAWTETERVIVCVRERKNNLLDTKEGVAKQLLANSSRDSRGHVLVHAPLKLLSDMLVVGLDVVRKTEVGLGVFMSTVDLGLDGQCGEDVQQTVVHISCSAFKETTASAYEVYQE